MLLLLNILVWAKCISVCFSVGMELIDAEVKIDTRKMSSYDAFVHVTAPLERNTAQTPGSLNDFIEKRRDFLINHEEIKEKDVLKTQR